MFLVHTNQSPPGMMQAVAPHPMTMKRDKKTTTSHPLDFREWTARNRSRHNLLDEDVDPAVHDHMNIATITPPTPGNEPTATNKSTQVEAPPPPPKTTTTTPASTTSKKRERSKIRRLEAKLRAVHVGRAGGFW